MTYLLGYSQEKITPDIVLPMGGYFPLRTSVGIHDPLYVKTHCIYNKKTKELFAFASLDTLAVDNKLKQYIESKVTFVLKDIISSFHLYIFATHTHSGPTGILDTGTALKKPLSKIFGEFDQEYLDFCGDKTTDSIISAFNDLNSFTYKVATTFTDKIGCNRNEIGGHCDFDIFIIEFSTAKNKTILVNYSCHPTVLDIKNQFISSDYLFSFYEEMEKNYQLVQFINGSCANISTRFTRSEASYEEADFFGHILAKEVFNASYSLEKELKDIRFISDFYSAKTKNSEMHYQDDKSNFAYKVSKALNRHKQNPTEITRANMITIDSTKSVPLLSLPFSIIRFDDYFFVTIPGEATSELTSKLRINKKIKIFGLCNDYLFYFANNNYFDKSYYEASSSFLKKGEAEKWFLYIESKLKEIDF
ncbi:hypothetical protein NRIC_38100 [Enterococcus florum]|uniref:Neutral/alkaline non-lysosomal ceramidase N-terminal domain-containing protein n=1 Tax=Enterococcus florum TaxID=2480627 RepID=A0A4V0WQ29_9ENTE|nr:neutral/alkaline non-lysosomal ceramidase N-terminal domain-containing protein [Enterococcus florum]GCF95919.1 hypothetical protein NRIC_38100 [Enterococcus florum]